MKCLIKMNNNYLGKSNNNKIKSSRKIFRVNGDKIGIISNIIIKPLFRNCEIWTWINCPRNYLIKIPFLQLI